MLHPKNQCVMKRNGCKKYGWPSKPFINSTSRKFGMNGAPHPPFGCWALWEYVQSMCVRTRTLCAFAQQPLPVAPSFVCAPSLRSQFSVMSFFTSLFRLFLFLVCHPSVCLEPLYAPLLYLTFLASALSRMCRCWHPSSFLQCVPSTKYLHGLVCMYPSPPSPAKFITLQYSPLVIV